MLFHCVGWAWLVIFAFVGDPTAPVSFFRAEAFGNAYVVIYRLVITALGWG